MTPWSHFHKRIRLKMWYLHGETWGGGGFTIWTFISQHLRHLQSPFTKPCRVDVICRFLGDYPGDGMLQSMETNMTYNDWLVVYINVLSIPFVTFLPEMRVFGTAAPVAGARQSSVLSDNGCVDLDNLVIWCAHTSICTISLDLVAWCTFMPGCGEAEISWLGAPSCLAVVRHRSSGLVHLHAWLWWGRDLVAWCTFMPSCSEAEI